MASTGDFNGDHKDDVLWRGGDGATTDWLGTVDGFTGNWDNFNNNPGNSWKVAGVGDFNGDGFSDILWRGDDGTLTDWLGSANGSFIGNWNSYNNNPGSNWVVAGIGDFDGDGRDDILLRGNDGVVTDWLGQANGSFVGNWNVFSSNLGTSWNVTGVGDFNGDDKADILWRKDDGTITDWLGQADGGFAVNSGAASQPLSLDLQIAGVGDFNGDGRDDVLLRASDGTLETWNGNPDGAILSPVEKLWQDALANVSEFIAAVADSLPYADSSGGGSEPPLTGYAAIFGPSFPNVNEGAFDTFIPGRNFTLRSFDDNGFSAALGDVDFGAISMIDEQSGTYAFDANGVEVFGEWHAGSPPPDSSEAIVITKMRDSSSELTPSGYFTFNRIDNGFNFNDGYGGGAHTATPTSSLNTALSHEARITVGHHNIYLPPLDSLTADQKAAALAFIAAVQAVDSKIGQLPSNATLSITESWTDTSGVSHPVTVTETGADLAAHWTDTSFALFTDSTFGPLNGSGTNGTSRGSSNMGPDPNMAGNLIAGFNLGDQSTGVTLNYLLNNQAAMEYLALHEVAHDSLAGTTMNTNTPNKDYDDFHPGTTNWVNENFANTLALTTMRALGLNLGKYDPASATGTLNLDGGWQTGNTWNMTHGQ